MKSPVLLHQSVCVGPFPSHSSNLLLLKEAFHFKMSTFSNYFMCLFHLSEYRKYKYHHQVAHKLHSSPALLEFLQSNTSFSSDF